MTFPAATGILSGCGPPWDAEADVYADRFVPYDGIYLLNHSVGRPPRTARDAADAGFLQPWEQEADEVWPRWLASIEVFRDQLAGLHSASAAEFCPQTNLSSALTKILYALPVRPDKPVLLFHQQAFPSMGYVLQQATRQGYQTRMIPEDADPQALSTWEQYLGDEVGLVLVTHVHSNTSAITPVAGITELARARDIVSVVDIAQSTGVVPVDLAEWQADFVLGSCVKWLCGGPGAGFLWANPAILPRCEPIDVGWFSHADPFEFDIREFRYAEDALRFWGGTPSVLPYVLAAHSIQVLRDIGIDTIRRHNLGLNQDIIDHVGEDRVLTPGNPSQRGGTVVLQFGAQQAKLGERLREAGVRFDARATGLRLSPHIYNSREEIDVVLSCLKMRKAGASMARP